MGKKLERFYVPVLSDNGDLWINGQEAHHMLHVKRMRLGEKLLLFDGRGREATGRIVETKRGRACIALEDIDEVDREARIAVTLAFSVPKGKRAEFLVQKCCELGVRRLIPLECERGVVRLAPEGSHPKSSHKVERWRSIAVEASKQCGRTCITEITEVSPFSKLINSAGAYKLKLLASTGREAVALNRIVRGNPDPDGILCVIGPEGGFTQKEIDLATGAGFVQVSLGPSVLRVETGAIAIVSMLLYAYYS